MIKLKTKEKKLNRRKGYGRQKQEKERTSERGTLEWRAKDGD